MSSRAYLSIENLGVTFNAGAKASEVLRGVEVHPVRENIEKRPHCRVAIP